MVSGTYRFEFDRGVPLEEAETTLHLALIAAEGLFGRARVRLDARYHIDEACRRIDVRAATEVGAAVARIFAAFLLREFGEEALSVRAVGSEEAA